ncbi:TlpA disulfide reductase family protein [Roseimicrobium sp. ORNL1]|uniref:TlpA family protein disulfide reductase n=1 Tax=Roseimicrobium sp. ORNL1 TaxID=2711231 RepID=UPI0013E10860|nr:TlpA disulfide reductase family protein [Roseimicrobium sp. ORNL1]QIF00874.1 TlpA family protein disulfide reductase [Roseimicrobium sp. ORNL1]
MQTRLLSLLAAVCALVTPNLFADAAADEAWKKVENAMKAIRDPQPPPKSRPEAIEFFKKAVAAYEGEAKDFYAKAPTDPRRWEAKYFELETAPLFGFVHQKEPSGLDKVADEILAAPDATDEVKGKAAGMKLALRMDELEGTPGAEAAWVKDAEAYIKQHPSSQFTNVFQRKLKTITALAGLKDKPLDLKFTAVDGREVDLSKMRGKVVLVDFWAVWCGPCVAEIPNVLKTYEKLHPKGFEIVGISLDQDKSKLEAFVKEKGMSWPQYFDGKGWQNEISSKFGINSIPAMWLVDKKGMLVSTNARGNLEELVEKQLATE